jgi:hypothetical protein
MFIVCSFGCVALLSNSSRDFAFLITYFSIVVCYCTTYTTANHNAFSSFVIGAWRFIQKRIGAAREAFHRTNEEEEKIEEILSGGGPQS